MALRYHDSTKHDFDRFARSLGYLDWAAQPDAFRRYAGSPLVELPRARVVGAVPYAALFDRSLAPAPFDGAYVGEFLRCALGLSAWKEFRGSRWALRVNPSSGNLHPTEAYVIHEGAVLHYAPRDHALEERARLDPQAWSAFTGGRPGLLAGLTSILWREAWKYGERAFRYCQHDTGHALAALRLSAAMLGWTLAVLPRWADDDVAALLGVDPGRAGSDLPEPEEPECLFAVTAGEIDAWREADPSPLVDSARAAVWRGVPNRLSPTHVDWPVIDEVAAATSYRGSRAGDWGLGAGGSELGSWIEGGPSKQQSPTSRPGSRVATRQSPGPSPDPSAPSPEPPTPGPEPPAPSPQSAPPGAREIILQRRSAVAFDGQSTLPLRAFRAMLDRLQPGAPPWDAIDWPPHVHLALFVHRVDGLTPGLYAWLRDAAVRDEWRAAMRPEFLWEPVPTDSNVQNGPNLFLLLPYDMTGPANRVSCDQDIAGDGFFSLAMVARLEAPLRERGEWFYRRLFWECGMIGQVLYLEAEAAGARSTGIGCFYDDPVHQMLGLTGAAWQSLYHFSMGRPVDDERITSEPGYAWEQRS